ncbi:nitroreductase family protein [Desulfomicrobium escambiense]|uniref:nitroreductase family protein n=1 Tax=Desulfomicrobium escambiense TaxID=29503 RepID=UPI000405F00B|nr:nitroreductase family protein [Desulfomicrobium escambiense]
MLKDIVAASRSYRRFDTSVAIPMQTLEDLVGLARLCPSAANRQPLRFILCNAPADNEAVFACLKWAAYLKDWDGPAPSERPAAYVIVVNTAHDWDMARIDLGIMAQTMLLGAVEKGLGGCMLGAIDRDRLRAHLGLAPELEISLVLALGKPAEDVSVVDVPADGSIRYWRDEAGRHFVPKRPMTELILGKREG